MYFLQAKRTIFCAVELSETSKKFGPRQELVKNTTCKNLVDYALVPLHIWLPEAHPAAPSHVSALMSGVMIKTAIYGILRITFDFLNPTTLVGIIYASQENDIKKLLAYSSIENIGIIFIPISTAIIFYSLKLYELAGISIVISLFHVLNHSIFKGLLLCKYLLSLEGKVAWK